MARSAKSKQKYAMQSIIICDDAREEITGKSILIGVYSDVVVVRGFPAAIHRLVFRFSFRLMAAASECRLSIVSSDGTKKVNQSLNLKDAPVGDLLNTGFVIVGMKFEAPETLSIGFGVDEEPRPVTTLEIRAAQTEQETERVNVAINA